jgi:ubiquinone/menaquinone biosynthesis C-methylase UbiE
MTPDPSIRLSPEDALAGAVDYTPGVLAVYDWWVLGFVCSAVWRCPRSHMLRLYDRNVGARHLDLGPGTGFFLDRCRYPTPTPRLALVDLNDVVLHTAARRLVRYRPALYRGDVLQLLDFGEQQFDSVGMNFLLHCLPGDLAYKATVFDNARRYVRQGGRIFGSTVLTHGLSHGKLAWKALESLNKERVMSNQSDSLDQLDAELATRFNDYLIRVCGSVALFEATVRRQ